MEQSPIITPLRYYAPRVAGVVFVLALLVMVRPAFAYFSSLSSDEAQLITVNGSQPPAQAAATLASAVSTGLDEALPSGKGMPDISVTAALATELGAPRPLLSYRANARWPLASLTKLMTSVVALENLGPATYITISQSAVDTEGEAGSLKAREQYTVIDLIRAMLTVSSNDAAIALAQAYDLKQLGREAFDAALNKTALFTAAMQEKARFLGMNETYYGDPSGLSVVNQSVVADLATLTNYVVTSHGELLDITRNQKNKILERRSMTWRTLTNINQFAGLAEFVGGKTGFTDESSGNLISVFKYNGKEYLFIVLGTEDRFGQTTKLYDWVKETAQ